LTTATVLTDRFDRALLYATHVHGAQVRTGTSTPYVAHLLAVAATVLEYGGDEDLAIAALCTIALKIRAARRGWMMFGTGSARA
jgi:(p)ppGpp synthase/HD superfamily hydrolase